MAFGVNWTYALVVDQARYLRRNSRAARYVGLLCQAFMKSSSLFPDSSSPVATHGDSRLVLLKRVGAPDSGQEWAELSRWKAGGQWPLLLPRPATRLTVAARMTAPKR